MRTETITRTIAKFNELDEASQAKVVEKLYDINVDHGWWVFVYEDATTILEMLGFSDVKIQFSGFASQGDGASFTGNFKVPATKKELKERQAKVKEYAPKMKLGLFTDMRFTQDEKDYGNLEVFRLSHHYAHANTVASDNGDLTDFVRTFSGWIYKQLSNEYDHLTSAESIRETIEANDYEFYTDTLKIA